MKERKKIRAGFIISNKLSDGGAERVVANLSNLFSGEIGRVVIISPKRDCHSYYVDPVVGRYYYENSCEEKDFRVVKVCKRLNYIREICRNENLDFLIGFLPGAINYCVLSTIGIKTKSIVSERNDPHHTYSGLMKRIWGKFIFRLADYAVFQTSDSRAWFPKRVQRNSEIILNPVSEVFFNSVRHPAKNLFVSCGRLVEQKNHRMLIDAFAIAQNKVTDIRLKIYGQGYLHSVLQDHIDELGLSDVITLCGATDDVASVLSSADCFILSSDFEGFPNALIEALAMGIPAISTDCPCGGPRMLDNGRNIINLVPVGDVQAMADAIWKFADNSETPLLPEKEEKDRALFFKASAISECWINLMERLAK